jgi:limonene-1,2-epoxide hydrolase
MAGAMAVVERLIRATNDHDIEGLVASFDADYRSEQPAHPERNFQGAGQVRENWSALLAAVPDIRWEILGASETTDTAWVELRLTGTRADGSTLHEVGVGIFGVSGERIAWARLYIEEVEEAGADIEATVKRMAGTE